MTTLLIGAAMSLALGGAAQAAQAPSTATSSFTSDTTWSVPPPHKQLQWDSKGRWGLRLDMAQPTNRDPDWKDVQAGAYFRITPSMQVRGSVGLGDPLSDPKLVTPQDAGPRVHLETAFRF